MSYTKCKLKAIFFTSSYIFGKLYECETIKMVRWPLGDIEPGVKPVGWH